MTKAKLQNKPTSSTLISRKLFKKRIKHNIYLKSKKSQIGNFLNNVEEIRNAPSLEHAAHEQAYRNENLFEYSNELVNDNEHLNQIDREQEHFHSINLSEEESDEIIDGNEEFSCLFDEIEENEENYVDEKYVEEKTQRKSQNKYDFIFKNSR
jgi:hypothetical protein